MATHKAVLGQARPQLPQQVVDSRLFYNNCTRCHGNPRVPDAPDPAAIRQMSPETIYQALTIGSMRPIATGLHLTDEQVRQIAEYMSGRRLGAGYSTAASAMPNQCATKGPLQEPQSSLGWNGWGFDLANTRFESANIAKLGPKEISHLRLLWAFGIPDASDLYDQPTVVGGRIYVSSDTGTVYSLDAATGCVYWSFQAQAGVRSAMTVGPAEDGSHHRFVFFGDLRGNVYALDALTGKQVWKVAVDPNPESRITGAPKLYKGRLYVPVASLEEAEATDVGYSCCTFRGMVVALDAETGGQIWKTYTIPDRPKPIGKNSAGKMLLGPSGADVWDSPTIDTKRNVLYVGTGNGFTWPETKFSDAIMAMDLDAGKVIWSFQATRNDLLPKGPDWDFAASPILAKLPNGKDLIIAGQKSGVVWALDPDKRGSLVWSKDVARVRPKGGGEILFGGAVDRHDAYFNLRSGGLVALDLVSGAEKWYVSFTPPGEQRQAFGPHGASSAVTVLPGAVFSGDLDGMLRALSPLTGDLIWQFNTARKYDKTVNRVPAKGGSIGSGGPVVVNGILYVTSGYVGVQRGMPGNALLAFSPGK
jgi:polyvinyl alcohol dehydrogenase (cytochrome)